MRRAADYRSYQRRQFFKMSRRSICHDMVKLLKDGQLERRSAFSSSICRELLHDTALMPYIVNFTAYIPQLPPAADRR